MLPPAVIERSPGPSRSRVPPNATGSVLSFYVAPPGNRMVPIYKIGTIRPSPLGMGQERLRDLLLISKVSESNGPQPVSHEGQPLKMLCIFGCIPPGLHSYGNVRVEVPGGYTRKPEPCRTPKGMVPSKRDHTHLGALIIRLELSPKVPLSRDHTGRHGYGRLIRE